MQGAANQQSTAQQRHSVCHTHIWAHVAIYTTNKIPIVIYLISIAQSLRSIELSSSPSSFVVGHLQSGSAVVIFFHHKNHILFSGAKCTFGFDIAALQRTEKCFGKPDFSFVFAHLYEHTSFGCGCDVWWSAHYRANMVKAFQFQRDQYFFSCPLQCICSFAAIE